MASPGGAVSEITGEPKVAQSFTEYGPELAPESGNSGSASWLLEQPDSKTRADKARTVLDNCFLTRTEYLQISITPTLRR